MKRIRSMLLAAVLLLALTGCSRPEAGESVKTEPPMSNAPILVSTTDELLAAIAPGAEIQLAEGEFLLSDSENYGKEPLNDYYTWESLGLGDYGLKLLSVGGLTIRGAGKDQTKIITVPRSANVLTLNNCGNTILADLTLGHTEMAEACEGGVVSLVNSRQITLENLGLFGCGSVGVWLLECDGVEIQNCEIYECSTNAAIIQASQNVNVTGASIHALGKEMPANSIFDIYGSANVTIADSEITGNYVHNFVCGTTPGTVTFRNNYFFGNKLAEAVFSLWDGNFILDTNQFEENQFRVWYAGGSVPAVDANGDEITFEDPVMDPVTITPGVAVPVTTADQEEVRVRSADEFLKAIAPNTCIVLDSEMIDLSATASYQTAAKELENSQDPLPKFTDPSNPNLYWENNFDGPSLVISGVSNLTIMAEGEDRTTHTISAVPRYANVLTFENCTAVTVAGFTAGHTIEPGYCMGGVLQFRNCEDVLVENCGLFGCGTMGVDGMNSRNIQVVNCEIYECSVAGIQLSSCDTVAISGTLIRDIGDEYGPSNFYRFYDNQNVTLDGTVMGGNYHGN